SPSAFIVGASIAGTKPVKRFEPISSGESMAVPDHMHRARHNFKPSGVARPLDRVKQSFFPRMLLVALLGLALAANLRADTISGTVKDPSGAVVVNARIEITGND